MNSAKLELRDAHPEETEILSALCVSSKAHWGYDRAFMEACLDELRISVKDIEDETVRVLEADDALVGVYLLAKTAVPDTFEIEAVFVVPSEIGRGYGKRLWTDLEEQAASLGARRLVVQSDPNAVNYYQSMGMKQTKSRESGSISGRYLPVLEKKI